MGLKLTKKFLDKMQGALDNLESKITNNYNGKAYEPCTEVNYTINETVHEDEPIALDVFGNYIYYGDDVLDVAYNDKRANYVTITEDVMPYAFKEVGGPINRNVILLDVYEKLRMAGHVTDSRKPGFWHVTNFD